MKLKLPLLIFLALAITYAYGHHSDSIIDKRDGKIYRTIILGNQVWMADNLNTETYNDGTLIPQVVDAFRWTELTTGAWSWYNNINSNGDKYGRLYNWYAVMGINSFEALNNVSIRKNICPVGWKIPTDADWTTLVNFLGKNAGGQLKTAEWPSPNTGYSKSIGFNALPGGYRDVEGGFDNIGEDAYWWSSTEYDSGIGWNRSLYYDSGTLSRYAINVKNGYSVRCIKDK